MIAGRDDAEAARAALGSPADLVHDAVRRAEELAQDGEAKAAREVIEAAIEECSPVISPELLWALADIEFADGDLEAGMSRLRDAVEVTGCDATCVNRQIRTLSRNRLRRDALRATRYRECRAGFAR
jgi:ATP/maltotriose-dependent transcriptional regulator MalT